MADLQTLPQMVRAKYPGTYDDLSDAELDAKVRTKFPGVYDDIPKPAPPSPSNGAQIGPAFRNTALPPDLGASKDLLGPEARKTLSTPLAHTGLSLIDNLTTPASLVATLVGGGLAAKEAQAAGVVAKTFAGMRGMLSSATPQIKYEIIKSTLGAVHVPAPIAMGIALTMSGKGGAKGAPAEGEIANPSPNATLSQGPAPALTAEQVAAQQAVHNGPTLTVAPTPPVPFAPSEPTGPTLRQGPTPAPVPQTPVPGPTLTIGQAPNLPRDIVSAEGPFAESGAKSAYGPTTAAREADAAARIGQPSPAELANARGLVNRGRSVIDAANQVARSNPSKAAAIVSALTGTEGSAAATLAGRLGTPNEIEMVNQLIDKGNSAAAAVKAVAGNDAKKFGALMTAYMQARQVKP